MRLLLRIANTSMTGREYFHPFPQTVRSIELNLHKLIHIPHHHHIAIQLDNPVIFLQGKRRELAPAVVESRVVCEIFMNGRKEVFDTLLGDFTDVKSTVTLWGKCVGVKGNERVLRAMLFERVVKGEKAGKIGRVCYKSCPYLSVSALCFTLLGC